MDDDGRVSEAQQFAQCETCEPPPPPDDGPPPPPPPPPACSQTYSNPASPTPWASTPSTAHSQAHDYALREGYPMGFWNYHQATYDQGPVRGTFLITDAAYAGWEDVPSSALGNPSVNDIPSMMRAAHSYAISHGYAAGMPTFHYATYNGVPVKGIVFFQAGAVEFRDLPACELGYPNVNDYGQMFRGANDYAVRNGYGAAFPTFHYANYGQGTVYGLILFRPGMTAWRDVRVADYDTSCGGNNQHACRRQCDEAMSYYDFWADVCYTTPPPPPPPPCGDYNEQCCNGGCNHSTLFCGASNTCEQYPYSSSNTVYVSLAPANPQTPFRYENNNVPNPALNGTEAAVAWVENTSGYNLNLRHTDRFGNTAVLAIDAGKTAAVPFTGLTVSGGWGADVGGSSFPLSITFKVRY
ncbi:hypothetical protein ACMHYB_45005 [Sorangium sp. So ce1128]